MRTEFITWFFSIATLTIFFSITIPVHSQCLEDQKSLLLQLKSSLKFDPDSSVKLVYWARTNDCCQWNGVTCDHSGRVIGLDLNTESISGGLNHSSSLFRLKFLEKLNLAYNNFNSTQIPSSFGILTNLRYLNLSDTGFGGQIPMEFSRLTKLLTLDLSIRVVMSDFDLSKHVDSLFYLKTSPQIENPNLFTLFRNLSEITELYLDGVNVSANGNDWGQAISAALPNLRVLSLSGCLLSGPIDSSLQSLQYLSEINLAKNNLSSPIPDFLANLPNLRVLILYETNLYGTFPDIMFQQVQTLETLDLSYNQLLNGSLPDFPQNRSLRNLVLHRTNFSGNLPESIENLRELRWIEISMCYFSGSIPSSLANLSQLVYLDFSHNNFTGPIPSFQESKNLTFIDLSYNALTGPVPSIYFEGLTNVEHLNLGSNSFHGSIPSCLFSLPSMQEILLSNNQFSGFLPNSSLSPLVGLDLSGNKLQGPIPPCFFDFQSIFELSLSFNNFTSTIQLESIPRLQNLAILDLSHNSLSVNASISDSSLSSFPQLQQLGLASCKLKRFPPLMNQAFLRDLDLSDNQISGVIPNWIWNVSDGSLGYLNLSCNLLVGFQPEYLIPITLTALDLHSNQLHGEIPILFASYVDYSRNNFSSSLSAEIGNGIASASFFSLSDNMLSGPIPPSICNGSDLEVLDLSNNRFTGTIPQCLIDKCTATLGILNLRNNNLTGNITGTFPKDCALRTLDLSENLLEGQVPKSMAKCANVEVLNLGNNNINGNFPCFLANLSSLRVLVLRSNKFCGNIHCRGIHYYMWPKLQIIDLALNNFSGILPPNFFLQRKAMMDGGEAKSDLNLLRFRFTGGTDLYYQDSVTVVIKGLEMTLVKILTIFTTIDFSNNKFKGEIPDTVGDLKSLYVLNLSHNALTGSIQSSLGNLTQLESLDLCCNKLGGSIPVKLASLTFLSFLNLSYNQLVGMIPIGTQLQSFPETSFKGNKGLWGAPLKDCCTEAEPTPPTLDGRLSYSEEDDINWVYIAATLGYTVGFGVIVGPLLYSKRWRQCYYKPLNRVIVRILHHREQRARHQRRRNNINQLRRRQHH